MASPPPVPRPRRAPTARGFCWRHRLPRPRGLRREEHPPYARHPRPLHGSPDRHRDRRYRGARAAAASHPRRRSPSAPQTTLRRGLPGNRARHWALRSRVELAPHPRRSHRRLVRARVRVKRARPIPQLHSLLRPPRARATEGKIPPAGARTSRTSPSRHTSALATRLRVRPLPEPWPTPASSNAGLRARAIGGTSMVRSRCARRATITSRSEMSPPPKIPRVRYHWVFASRSSWRPLVTPKPPREAATPKPCAAAPSASTPAARGACTFTCAAHACITCAGVARVCVIHSACTRRAEHRNGGRRARRARKHLGAGAIRRGLHIATPPLASRVSSWP
jgi:hypothetical protein